jgi:hypothetical protein
MTRAEMMSLDRADDRAHLMERIAELEAELRWARLAIVECVRERRRAAGRLSPAEDWRREREHYQDVIAVLRDEISQLRAAQQATGEMAA